MKVLIGYDGSPSADEALEELKRAGLPAETKILIVTAGEVWMPPANIQMHQAAMRSRRVAGTMARLQTQAEQTLKEAGELGSEAAARIKFEFPDFQVETEIMTGDAGAAIIKKAAEWQADLIIVGSQNRSAIKRLFLGSVARIVVAEAGCSVRVARPGEVEIDKTAARRVIAAIDDSDSVDLIVGEIARREWARESVVQLVSATDTFAQDAVQPFGQILDVQTIQRKAREKLAASGLKVLTVVKEGDAKTILLAEAETLSADCIFVGTREIKGTIKRYLLGSVSTAILNAAPCSVEVVRARAD